MQTKTLEPRQDCDQVTRRVSGYDEWLPRVWLMCVPTYVPRANLTALTLPATHILSIACCQMFCFYRGTGSIQEDFTIGFR